mgnify:CR=1 FL=1|jgi:hypothetical protein|nr:MAG TPA: hypothetical protein [Crassvirales sp.]
METKEVKITIPEGYEIDREHSTFECVKFKKKVEVNTWKDLNHIKGYFINVQSDTLKYSGLALKENKNIFASEKYAKAALALAQISQLMPYYGGIITNKEWENNDWKFCVSIEDSGEPTLHTTVHLRDLISFHTEKQRDRFLSFPENVQLVKDLYMTD